MAADPHQRHDLACQGTDCHHIAGSASCGQPAGLRAAERRLRDKPYGGDCHNYALLAAGHIDLVLEDGLATHDIMGVVQLITAAGGVVTDKTGAPVSLRGTSSLLAAATPALHAAALEVVASGD